jgi:hypothetical protein
LLLEIEKGKEKKKGIKERQKSIEVKKQAID